MERDIVTGEKGIFYSIHSCPYISASQKNDLVLTSMVFLDSLSRGVRHFFWSRGMTATIKKTWRKF